MYLYTPLFLNWLNNNGVRQLASDHRLLTGCSKSSLKTLGLPHEKGSTAGWRQAAGFYYMYIQWIVQVLTNFTEVLKYCCKIKSSFMFHCRQEDHTDLVQCRDCVRMIPIYCLKKKGASPHKHCLHVMSATPNWNTNAQALVLVLKLTWFLIQQFPAQQ